MAHLEEHGVAELFDTELTPPGLKSPSASVDDDADLLGLIDGWFDEKAPALPELDLLPLPSSDKKSSKELSRSVTPFKISPLRTPTTTNLKRSRVDNPPPLADDSDHVRLETPQGTSQPKLTELCACLRKLQVIDVHESRLAKTQRTALSAGRSTQLSWQYDNDDQLVGAFCDGQWFGRAELVSCSTL